MGELKNKGEISRVEALEMQIGTATISASVKLRAGVLDGIDSGNLISEEIATPVTFYMTTDGRTWLTGSVELDAAEKALAGIKSFVDAVKAEYGN